MTYITDTFHEYGVRVLWPYNPWDTVQGSLNPQTNYLKGTRDTGLSDEVNLDTMIKDTHGDGFNGVNIKVFFLAQYLRIQ